MTKHARGFTLIELMISIGIIGILISMLLPALSKMRLAAKQTKGMANLSSVAKSFELYGNSYGTYPFIEPGSPIQGPNGPMPVPEGMVGAQWIRPGAIIISSDPFEMEWMWASPMAKFTEVEKNYPTWVSPGLPTRLPDIEDVEPREQISVRLSNSFIARPELFGPNGKDDPKMIAPVRQGDVLSPSSKVMLFDAHVAYYSKRPQVVDSHYDAPTPMAFADGHGDAKNPVKANDAVANIMRGNSKIKLHSTANGVRGQDY